jgi:hypothetical protein
VVVVGLGIPGKEVNVIGVRIGFEDMGIAVE